MKMLVVCAAVLAAALVQPAWAQSAAAQAKAPDNAAKRSTAAVLATLLVPSDVMEGTTVRAAKQAFEAGFVADDGNVLKSYPLLPAALWTKVEPLIRRSARADVAPYRSMIADLLATKFSGAELDAVSKFYATSTGKKMIAGMYANMDVADMATEMIRTGNDQPSAQSIVKLIDDAKVKTVAAITPNDHPALMKLASAMSMSRLALIGQEMQAAAISWGAKPNPKLDAEMEILVEKELVAYMEKNPPKD